MLLTKDAPALRVKTTVNSDELAEGQFDALVSVFGNVDAYGDVVMPGAFSRTLKEWEASGYKIPVYWGHQMSDPDYNIGEIVSAVETERGLQVRAQLDLDSPKAAQVYRLLKGGRVKEFSFGYSVRDASWGELDGQEVYQLRDVDLYEVSVVPVGANPETELQSVKTLGERTVKAGRRALDTLQAAKAGRVLSAKNESALREVREQLVEAIEGIDDILSALPGDDEDSPEPDGDGSKDVQQEEKATEQEPDPGRGNGVDTKSAEEPPGAPMPGFAADPLVALLDISERSMQ